MHLLTRSQRFLLTFAAIALIAGAAGIPAAGMHSDLSPAAASRTDGTPTSPAPPSSLPSPRGGTTIAATPGKLPLAHLADAPTSAPPPRTGPVAVPGSAPVAPAPPPRASPPPTPVPTPTPTPTPDQ